MRATARDAVRNARGPPERASPGMRPRSGYSTVTDFARLRGLSTSVPRASAAW
jgi:hypothetical protein